MELTTWNLPVLALRGLTVFPHMSLTFDVERKISIAALERAMEGDQDIFLVTQREIGVNTPEEKDLYTIGTIAHISQILRLGQTTVRCVVDGRQRAHLRRLWQTEPFLQANVEAVPEEPASEAMRKSPRTEALLRQTYALFSEYAEQASGVPEEVVAAVMDSRDPGFLADYIAQNISLRYTDKQEILEELSPFARLRKLNGFLARENNVLGFEHEMESKVRDQLVRTQREQILRTQIRVLQNELGEADEGEDDEIEAYRQEILALQLPEETEQHLLKEVNKLAKQPFGSAEGAVIRNYLDVCLEMPWNTTTKERVSVAAARKVLEHDHFGLEKVKERILETIAVRQMNPDAKGQILCLVGPPGVGKTSIAISVARALNRKLARLSLGGVRDEADIRGHRKTYIGSMPGRIIEAISRSGSMNPLLLLDEIDKLGQNFKGDPASALLEVLDPEQNREFTDHYVDMPFDLSRVLFITTANDVSRIPGPLYDRMDIIELGSYTQEEKLNIAMKHLVRKQLEKHGLTSKQLRFTKAAVRELIEGYTREAGVRTLERMIASVCRKAAKMVVSDPDFAGFTVRPEDLEELLGPRKFTRDQLSGEDTIGLVNGLAWTSVGGELLPIEVAVMEGTGKIQLTGSLGDVMKESANAAITCIRTRAGALGISPKFYEKCDIHIHAPEGAVPKDGPSAGTAMATAITSALCGIPVRHDVAMTGEITLQGRVLPIGGLKEKAMAAYKNHIKTVLIPADNVPDLAEVDEVVKKNITFIPVKRVDTVLETALEHMPRPVRPDTVLPEGAHKESGKLPNPPGLYQ